jgi:hypothetical protein
VKVTDNRPRLPDPIIRTVDDCEIGDIVVLVNRPEEFYHVVCIQGVHYGISLGNGCWIDNSSKITQKVSAEVYINTL